MKGGLSILQTQAITRHKSERMTEWYLHFDASEFVKAKQVQEDLLSPDVKKPVKSKAAAPEKAAKGGKTKGSKAASGKTGRVPPFPGQEDTKKQKRA
ncbi:hypothetical protein FACS1894110_18300 [Spirochaetia bacterium]|nr:hypothetical protein FACS1894110_18300 [Spirochaetia bacterium]